MNQLGAQTIGLRRTRSALIGVLILLLSAIIGTFEAVGSANASTSITVNTFADENGTGANCSLREAIAAANMDIAVAGCPAGSGADTIGLPPGTYVLTDATAGSLNIISTMTISPTSGTAVIQGAAGWNHRILSITGTAELIGLTIENGHVNGGDGGGMLVNPGSQVSIVNSTIANNVVTATVDGNGFGGGIMIDSGSQVTMTNSSVAGNTTVDGSGGGVAQAYAWVSATSPTSNDLSAVAIVSATDGWAVGGGGTILHWDGNSWITATSPVTSSLSSLAVVSSTNGWAVGWNGTIAHLNGSGWSTASSPTANPLWSVTVLSDTDGWIVGDGGTILRWNGHDWQSSASPTSSQLFSVAMVSATDGWIAGYDGTHGIMLRWNGSTWMTQTIPPEPRLLSVAMVSATDGWAVGENAAILHWNGSQWSDWVNPPAFPAIRSAITWLSSVRMVSGSDGWAVGGYVGSSVIVHWDGTRWSVVASPATNWLQSVTMLSPQDGWAVGYGGVILRYRPVFNVYLPTVVK